MRHGSHPGGVTEGASAFSSQVQAIGAGSGVTGRDDSGIVGDAPRRSIIDSTVEVLLVEDNPSDVELTVRALRRAGLESGVHIAGDGVEAMEYLFGAKPEGAPARRPALVLLDLKLPRVSGLELLAAIKSNEASKSIPVVILSSSREVRDIDDAYRAGANSYIVKPVEFEEFTAAIARVAEYWLGINERPS
ncbi:MAG: response regulator [Acidobacteria bacterium]|nr:response regulator [Acidobacteriota bacterium]